jgi:two-component system, NarL family, invasion response regulator UvrY
MNTAKITVILVDDHAIVRAGFRLLLATESDIDVIAEASRGEEILQIYSELKPDIVVMDLSMAGIGGLETTRRLVMREEGAKIIVFSVHHEKVYIQRALDAGARGYICKHAHPDMLIDAIKQVAKGRIYIDPSLVDDAQHQEDMTTYQTIIATLSPREFDVFVLLAKGMTAHQISDELCLSYKTVANYGTTIRSKLNVTSMAQLANIATLLKPF